MAKKEKIDTLVTVEEQPYPVPENWRWVRIGSSVGLHRGVSYKKEDAHTTKQINDCLIMRGGNIGEGYIDIDADNVYVDMSLVDTDQLVRENDIIIVASTGSTKVIGRAGISRQNYKDVAFGAFLLLVRPSGKVNGRYISYFFQSDLYRNRIRDLASGVNINNIRSDYILNTPCPLPPFSEQGRIVVQIESLFAKLDEAKEKAQAVVDGFEDRKAAILHKAFTGELTAKWREKNGIRLEDWKTCCVGEIGEVVTGSTPDTKCSGYYNGLIPFIKPTELNQGRHVREATSTLTEKGKDVSRLVRAGSTCVCCIGATISKCGFLEVDAVTNQQINTIVPYDSMNDLFVYYYCSSKQFVETLIENSSATTLPIINKSKMSVIRIPVPTKAEQCYIVSVLERILENEIKQKSVSKSIVDMIDSMKKSILAKAFRGELGTNDPSELPVDIC